MTPPIFIGLTLPGVKNCKVLRSAYGLDDLDAVIVRDVVSPPEVLLSDFSAPPDVVLRPLFDYVWNGGGWPSSPNYGNGRWIAPS